MDLAIKTQANIDLSISKFKNIVVLTGAGVSVASGLRPYRGPDGLWNDPQTAKLSDIKAFYEDPLAVWNFWASMRKMVMESEPNAAHNSLAKLENQLTPDQNFLLVTQNIDGLHAKAGSKNIAEIHGNIMRTKCSSQKCSLQPFVDTNTDGTKLSYCPQCNAILRADVVQFGEILPIEDSWKARKAVRDCDLFIAIGTSGEVAPACNYVHNAAYAGARTIYINVEPMEIPDPNFKESIIGKAEEILPEIIL
jgi:NAD-dependent deacetylase